MNLRFLSAAAAGLALACPSVVFAAETDNETIVLDTFQVTGSNLSVAMEEDSLPVTRLTLVDVEALGAATFADVVAAIPASQNISFNDTATGPNDARGDVASINLRNLGAGRSLVLLNGRRMSVFGVTPGTPPIQFVNLNAVPFAAIASVDILRDGASAIYGSDAIGGVLNTRLESDYQGGAITVRQLWGDPAPNDFNLDLAYGQTTNDGRTHVAAFASYFHREGLMARDREYAAHADKRPLVDEPFASNTRFDRSSSSGPHGRFTAIDANGDPVAVTGVTGTTGAARGRFYYDPATGARAAGTGPAAFYDFQPDGQLIPSVDRYSLYVTGHHQLSDRLSWFGELSIYSSESDGQTATTPISEATDGVIVPATNYYNPVGTRFYGPGTANPTGTPRDVVIRNYRPVEIGPRSYQTDIDSLRLVTGLRGRTAGHWDWESGLLYMTGKTYQVNHNHIAQSLFVQQLARSTPDAFNPFGGPNANTPAQFDPFVIDIWDRGRGTIASLDGRFSGRLFEFAGRPVNTAFGAEVRRESMVQRNDPFGLADDVIAQSEQIDISASRDVYAAYAEALVPLFGDRADTSTRSTGSDLRLAARYENYDRFDALTPSVALSLRPAHFLLLRASYNEGFRAPGVAELFQPQRARRNEGLIDGAREGQEDAVGTFSKRVVTGGNPDLEPEESNAFNVGFVVDVKPIPGLAVSMDFFAIELNDRIDNPDPQEELNLDQELWETNGGSNPRVRREPQTANDIALGLPGRLSEIHGTYQNLNTRRIEGFDVNVKYDLPETRLGRFTLSGDVSYTGKLEDEDRDGNVTNQIRNTANPRVKALATLVWRQGSWSAAFSGRFLSDYENSSTYDSPTNDPDAIPLILDDTWLFNASLGYSFSSEGLDGLAVRLGVNNLTDQDPPLYMAASDGYDSSYYDAKGRQWFLQLSRKF